MENNKLTLEELEDYKVYLKKEERSKATIEKYLRDIVAFYKFLPEDKYVTKEIVIAYKESLAATYEVTSINSMLAAVNGFLQFKELGHCRVKSLKVQKKVYCEERRELTKEEYLKLLSAADKVETKRIYMILQTLCGTGIRISELKFFTVESVKAGHAKVQSKGKTRTVFIPALLRNKLLVYAKEKGIKSGNIFITRNGKPADRSNIWREMQKICKVAGIAASKVFPHNLRHLFAKTFYNAKKDLSKLADILGHSSIETTRIYTISTGREHEQQIECLGLVI